MQFGVMLATKVDDWALVKFAEELGYDMAWLADSQMIWSDCYATLALAAHHTSRIRIGTGVAIAGTRLAPVTAHSIASINRLAPGRTFLGIGTGHTSMRVMGMPPMKIADFSEYLRVVRGLLDGNEVEYTLNGRTRAIRFLHRDLGFVNVDDRIPMYVAANGPRALALTGTLADGWVSGVTPEPGLFAHDLGLVTAGAQAAGRTLPADFLAAGVTAAVVLRPGEAPDTDRVIDGCGSQVACTIHFLYEIVKQTGREEILPPALRAIWEDYCAHVDAMKTPAGKRYLELHDGHCTYLRPEERRFMTRAMIEESCLVGEPDAIIARIRAAEAAGLKQLVLLPPRAAAREMLAEFATQVMARY